MATKGFKLTPSLLWNLHWRIRDELIYRREEDRHGGHYHVKDEIALMDDHDLHELNAILGEFRRTVHGDADT